MKRNLIPWGDEISGSLSGFRREMDTLFDRFFRDTSLAGSFAPSTNVAETENAFEVTLDLPGMSPDDIDVQLVGGQLVVRGEKKEEKEEKDKTFHRVERSFGQFERVIPLGSAVEEDKVSAEYKNGVLQITVPKTEKAKPKKISVK